MATSSKRDNAYYLSRIAAAFPTHYAEYLDGKYPSVAELRRATGLISRRTPFHELRNAWDKASASERDAFRVSLGLGASRAVPLPAASPPPPMSTSERRLEPWAKKRIVEIMTIRGMLPGGLAVELGQPRLNPSIGNAIKSDYRLKAATLAVLERWLIANASVIAK